MKTKHIFLIIVIFCFVFNSCKKENNNSTECKDIEGYEYKTVKIGNQLWMAENLRCTKYNDGTSISNPLNTGFNHEAYYWYNNDSTANKVIYGALYDWYTVKTGKLCPTGWHVPSDIEWKTLEMFLGMTQAQADAGGCRGTDQGNKLKEAGNTHWLIPSKGTNSSGFSALPGGFRDCCLDKYYSINKSGGWWTNTKSEELSDFAIYRTINYDIDNICRSTQVKECGFSIRCIRD